MYKRLMYDTAFDIELRVVYVHVD